MEIFSNSVDLSESNDPNILQKLFDDLLTENDLAKKELQVFSKITNVTRRCLANVGHLVSNYYRLKDAEAKLAKVHSRFLIYCGKSEEALESENHALKSSYADSIFDEWGEILDNCKIAFKLVKDKYPESDMVVNYLDFVDGKTVATKVEKDGSVGSFNSSESAAVGKGEDYVKKKVPKIKKEIEDRFSILSDNFHSGKTTSLEGLKELCSKLENLEEKLSASGSFELLLKELLPFDKESVELNETWQSEKIAVIQALLAAIHVDLEKKRNEVALKASTVSPAVVSGSSSFNTYFRKQDPPTFSGDVLEWLEFTRVWQSQVHSHKPPADFELDLLKKSIPDEGRKKLYGVTTLTSAWEQLKKLYGDEELIFQKLKIRLKSLKPKAKESHEKIIEIYDEIEYLCKRLSEMNAQDILYFDIEFLNACYMNLPPETQYDWDKFDKSSYDKQWKAFMVFMQEMNTSALGKRARVESLKNMGASKQMSALAISANNTADKCAEKDISGKSKYELKFDSLKEKVGLCKLCDKTHTYKDRFQKVWPSNRFLSCDKFKSLSVRQRAQTLEKNKACARCTSWAHTRANCSAKVISCEEKINGSNCGLDHSKFVCGSGIAYVMAFKTKSGNNLNKQGALFDENAPTLSYQQDVPIKIDGRKSSARFFWDIVQTGF